MARPNKIEQLELQHIVARCLSQGITASRQIAAECSKEMASRGIKEELSHSAVARYLESSKYEKNEQIRAAVPTQTKKAAVVQVSSRVERIVNYDLDIIDLQYKTTSALYDRFVYVDGLPDMVESRLAALVETALNEEAANAEYLSRWKLGFVDEMRRNINALTSLNKELRENAKFMTELREKAFEFKLIQEFLGVYMDIYKEVSPEAHDVAMQKIAANPRLERIVEQQKELRGYEE